MFGMALPEFVNSFESTLVSNRPYSVFIIMFVNSLQMQISFNVLPYVTSSFSLHSLTATTGVVSSIVGGVSRLPLARLLDVVGRGEGFVLMVFLTTIAIIMMATCNNVETYAAAQVFYWIGMNGMDFVLDVFIADTSSLKNRAIMYAFTTSPFIATTFAGPAAAGNFIDGAGWRWAYGTFAIVTPAMTLPFIALYWWKVRQARSEEKLVKQPSGRTFPQSVKYYLIEFDVLGLLLICAGFSMFLLPFSLASYQADQWRSPMIICLLVFGLVSLVLFAIWEKFFAPRSFMPFWMLKNRTVLGACLSAGTNFISFYCWNALFRSYLQVVHNVTIAEAGYIANIFNLGSCAFAFVVAALVRGTHRFKWIALTFTPLQILGTGLMIYFRQPNQAIGYVIMCQIFIAFARGALVICEQIAVMAAVPHENVAVALALHSMFASVGNAIGASLSGGIWTNILPERLERYLPEELQPEASTIYGDLTVQLSYPMGSPARDAILQAYGDVQRLMTIAATCFLILTLLCVIIWRNINLKEVKEVKGLAF